MLPATNDNASIDKGFVPEESHPTLLELRRGIMAVGTQDTHGLGSVVPGIVNDVIDAGIPTSLVELLPFFKRFAGLRRQKAKIKQVVSKLLESLLDPTLEYEMELGDVIEVCKNCGLNLTPTDHGNIYRNILDRLRSGAIRNYCVENGLIRYLNSQLQRVKDNYQAGRTRGIID